MGKYKEAIFDEKIQMSLLEACETDKEYIIVWMFINTGIHSKDLGGLKVKNIDGHNILWRRAKNKKPRREMLPDDIMDRLIKFLNNKRRPKSRTSYLLIVQEIGDRIGLDHLSPMSLRHTFCINLLQEYGNHPQCIDFVAKRMGCSRDVVVQNYIDLHQWVKLGR